VCDMRQAHGYECKCVYVGMSVCAGRMKSPKQFTCLYLILSKATLSV